MPEIGIVTPPRGKQAEALGLPNGFKVFTPFPFAGINQKASRYAMKDQEHFWSENFILTGEGLFRCIYDIATTPIYTAPGGRTVVSFFFYNIGTVDYCAVFLDDGTAVQVAVDTLVQTTISSVGGTFYTATSGTLPACAQWGSQYLLIANNNTKNDYWCWDGSLLFQAGTLGPLVTLTSGGANYSTSPTLTFYGGAGTGAAATTILDNGQVVLVNLTNPGSGYGVNDLPQVAFSGGGSDTGAILTANLVAGVVKSITVTNQGGGYTPGTVPVTITGGGGVGATAQGFVGSNGHLNFVTVTAGGSGYTTAPTIAIGGGGTGATAFATIAGGYVDSITVVDGGTNYIYPPLLTLIGGAGTDAQAIAVLQPTSIAYVKITDPGSGYSSKPAITVATSGEPGSGLSLTPVVHDGHVVSMTVNNPGAGYTVPPAIGIAAPAAQSGGTQAQAEAVLVGVPVASILMKNKGQNYTSAPAVVITPGANNAAYATIDLMPFGNSGSCIETFNSRVWLGNPFQKPSFPPNGGTLLVSSANSLTDFSPGNAGILFGNTSTFLRKAYTALKQSNGYLYPIGDSSVDVVSNIQVSGDPPVASFNYQNTDPQTGSAFKNTVVEFGRTILLTNRKGMYGLYGGAVTRVSDNLLNVFINAKFPPTAGALTPTAAVADIFDTKLAVLLMTITDPFTGASRNMLFGWDEKNWFPLTQTANLTFIGTQIVDSSLKAWGTDGSTIKQLFTTPSASLAKVYVSKLYGAQTSYVMKEASLIALHGQDLSSGSSGATVSVVINSELGNVTASYSADLRSPLLFSGGAQVPGYFIGFTLGSTSPDFALYNALLGYTDVSSAYGSQGGQNAPSS